MQNSVSCQFSSFDLTEMTSEPHVDVVVDEDILISTNSFDCMKNAISKAGFREGAIAGKEKNVQTGFDVGYEEGFTAGKSIGYLNGLHFATQALTLNGNGSQQQTDISCPDARFILQNSSKGACQLCVDDSSTAQLEDETESTQVESLEQLVKTQATALENALTLVQNAYKFPFKNGEGIERVESVSI